MFPLSFSIIRSGHTGFLQFFLRTVVCSLKAKYSRRYVCMFLELKHLTTTASHPQTDGQAERNNKTIFVRLHHHIAEHNLDWYPFVQPLTYKYNAQVHCTTGTTPFSFAFSRQPLGRATFVTPTTMQTDARSETAQKAIRYLLLSCLS